MKGNRGTSLVELLVMLALMSTMVLVAAGLVVHSMKLLAATGRSVHNPMLVHVNARLRRDVQEASRLLTEEWVWSRDPLVLVRNDGSLVHIWLEDGALVRATDGGPGGGAEERVLLRGVSSWWWRSPVTGVVDLNIGYLVNPEPEQQTARDAVSTLEHWQESLRFAIRGSGGGRRW